MLRILFAIILVVPVFSFAEGESPKSCSTIIGNYNFDEFRFINALNAFSVGKYPDVHSSLIAAKGFYQIDKERFTEIWILFKDLENMEDALVEHMLTAIADQSYLSTLVAIRANQGNPVGEVTYAEAKYILMNFESIGFIERVGNENSEYRITQNPPMAGLLVLSDMGWEKLSSRNVMASTAYRIAEENSLMDSPGEEAGALERAGMAGQSAAAEAFNIKPPILYVQSKQ